jgi:hypothetical protein
MSSERRIFMPNKGLQLEASMRGFLPRVSMSAA